MVVIGLLLLILASLWIVFYQLIKQQGRILVRLDQLQPQLQEAQQPSGIGIGEPFPSFNLPDLTGKMISLEDFQGKLLLVVNWSPGCGHCDLIAPDLARLESDSSSQNLQVVLLAHGDTESNRKLADEHGLKCPILLVDDKRPPEAFKNLGTPAAYLLDEQGRVAKPLTIGSEDIPVLLREIASTVDSSVHGDAGRSNGLPGGRPLTESRIERSGLKAGTPAPVFRLPDVHGQMISLEEYRGRRVLLVFTDPHCGPCDQIAADLVRLHRKHRDNGLAFLMVGRGDAEENRRKAEDHGIAFPVVLQEKWKLSKEYGIFSTPAAFLVGEDGVIQRNVAVGADAILELAREGLHTGREATHEHSI